MVAAARAKAEQAGAEIARAEAEAAYRKGEAERYQQMVAGRSVQAELAAERANQHQAALAALAGARAGLATARANQDVEEARRAQCEADIAAAKARLKVAGADLDEAKVLAEYARVTAPFPGVVTRRLVDTGAFVQSAAAGKPDLLFTLARVDRMRILADVPESDSALVAVGQAAALRIDALRGQAFAGKVVRFADALDASTRTMRVEVELDALHRGLRPGQFGAVTITLADHPDALLLPAGVLLAGGDKVASTELVRLLRLDPAVTLTPVESRPTPIDLADPGAPLPALLEQGLVSRPELAQNQALVAATLERLRQETWRPYVPAVQLGFSAGGFGGGEGADLGRFGGRSDFDALLVWDVRNLGFGNRALRRAGASQHAQARLTAEQVRDNVLAEVARAYHQVQYRRRQIRAAEDHLKAVTGALPLNFKGVLGGALRAIEAQQAVQALAAAQNQYLASVVDYNRAQFELLRAIGRPLDPGATCHPAASDSGPGG